MLPSPSPPPSRVPLEVFPRSCGWASLLHLCLCIGKGRPKRWSRSRTARSVPTASPIATPSRSQLAIGICSLKPPRYSDASSRYQEALLAFIASRRRCAPNVPHPSHPFWKHAEFRYTTYFGFPTTTNHQTSELPVNCSSVFLNLFLSQGRELSMMQHSLERKICFSEHSWAMKVIFS